MKNFAYLSPDSVGGATSQLGASALALAGGTDLLNLMKDHVVEPDTIVNLKNIGSLRTIAAQGDGLRIGASATIAEILANERVKSSYPALAEALENVATPQIRNMSTIGGNLCARPRCWFYRDEHADCLKRGGAACAAIDGDNELHAIFNTEQKCVMVHPSSAAPALIAYGATARIAGRGGEREVPFESFFTLPSVDMNRENVLAPDEILAAIELPAPRGKSATYEVRQKESHDWPLALASVVLELADGKITNARIVLGAVAPVPLRAKATEDAVRGQYVEAALGAADKAVENAKPLTNNKYKVQLTRTAVKRAILAAATGRRV